MKFSIKELQLTSNPVIFSALNELNPSIPLVPTFHKFHNAPLFTRAFAGNYCERRTLLLNGFREQSQLKFTCSKLTIETVEHGVKYVQS